MMLLQRVLRHGGRSQNIDRLPRSAGKAQGRIAKANTVETRKALGEHEPSSRKVELRGLEALTPT
jgi:hypothetical protein